MTRIIIHRQSPDHLNPAIGKPLRWLIDGRGVRYWLMYDGPGWGWSVFSDDLRAAAVDGLHTLDDVREWAAQ